MADVYEGPWPSIKIDGELRRRGKGPHYDVEVRTAYGIFQTDVLTHLLSNVRLSGIHLTNLGSQWRLMLKGKRKKRYLVAFFYAPTLREVYTLMATSTDIGYVDWIDDAHPPKA